METKSDISCVVKNIVVSSDIIRNQLVTIVFQSVYALPCPKTDKTNPVRKVKEKSWRGRIVPYS